MLELGSDKTRGATRNTSKLRHELTVLRAENARLRSENRRLRASLDEQMAPTTVASRPYWARELTAGTSVGPRRRRASEPD